MAELKCPHCGQIFSVDDTELSSIVSQIRDEEFTKDVEKRTTELKKHLEEKHKLEIDALNSDMKLKLQDSYDKQLQQLREGYDKDTQKLRDAQAAEIQKLRETYDAEIKKLRETYDTDSKKLRETLEAENKKIRENYDAETKKLRDEVSKAELENQKLSGQIESAEDKKRVAVLEAVKEVEDEKRDLERTLQAEKDKNQIMLAQKDEQIEFYKDLKTKMSTKMVGETLEQHCEIQFNQLRATAFPNAYFEKDNDARSGSKGDYIYRENDEFGNEIISIMFEMKNEMDTTSTKHKNEDFFKELDKDRKEKGCEYAVLVSLLESDSELYNAGIVDVSYRYDKMYVVRPQCFIPMITLLRNAAMNALMYKQELAEIRNQDIDITNFEDSLLKFKDDFGRNYELAHSHFDKAIEEIDKTIQHLEKVKKELLGSDNQLRIANNKVEDVSVKRLTRGNPTMQAKFEELKKG